MRMKQINYRLRNNPADLLVWLEPEFLTLEDLVIWQELGLWGNDFDRIPDFTPYIKARKSANL